MTSRLARLVERWCDLRSLDRLVPAGFGPDDRATRPPARPGAIDDWEDRHGQALPPGLRAWLGLSDGLFGPDGPLIHPISAIGPMVAFARLPGLIVQPESWFELGNPGTETVCLDLAPEWDEPPVFTSGDTDRSSHPRIIAPGFDAWLSEALRSGGVETWLDSSAPDLGDPWIEHRRRVPPPPLAADLVTPSARWVRPMLAAGLSEWTIARRLGISPLDVEAILRHVQHVPQLSRSPAGGGSLEGGIGRKL